MQIAYRQVTCYIYIDKDLEAAFLADRRIVVNIVVLAGGTSTERDVSIMTSMMVCGSLRRNGHHANMIDVFTGSGKYKHSSEFFQEDNDLKKLNSVVVNLAVYDHSQAGESYMQSYSENGISRNWKDRDDLFVGVYPFVKML